MAITSYDNRRTYAGNGSTTAFSFPPPFTANADLVVQIQAANSSVTTKAIGTDYAVSGAGNPVGGSVTMIVAPAVGETLIIYRDVPLTQPLTLLDGGPLPASTLNGMFDRVTMWSQRLREMANAAFSNATQAVAGLMSAADKYKLDNVEAGAQVNVVTSVAGRAGAVSLAKTDVGLGNVDNTSDVNKPVSAAQQTALNGKLSAASNLSDLANATTSRANLGVALGTNVQAFNARLADIAGAAWAQGDFIYFNGSALVRLTAGTSGQFLRTNGTGANPSWVSIPGGGDMLVANNLSELTATAATARLNIGAGTVSSVNLTLPAFLSVSGGPITGSGTFAVTLSGTALPVANGGTGQTSLATAAEVQAGASKLPQMDTVLSAMAWGSLSDSATISIDHAAGVNRTVVIAGNRTVANPTNPKVGWPLNISVAQDATGNRTLSWGANFSFGAGGAPALSTAAGTEDLLAFVCRSSTKFIFLGITRAI